MSVQYEGREGVTFKSLDCRKKSRLNMKAVIILLGELIYFTNVTYVGVL